MSPMMREEGIHEPLGELVARFTGGKIVPLSFRWRQRDYQVRRMNAHWLDRSLTPITHGFTVTIDTDDIVELAYQEGNPVWRIERIFLPG